MLRSFPNIVKQILMPVLPNLADLRFRYETCFISVGIGSYGFVI